MKNYFFKALVASIVVLSVTSAQAQQPKYWQAGLFSGASFPTGTYKSPTGRVGMGYVGGAFVNHYFVHGFGLGADGRFVYHRMLRNDTLKFQGGTMTNQYVSPSRFQHIGLTVGPTYEIKSGIVGLELFAKGGVLFQQFPSYTRISERFVYEPPQKIPVLRRETRYQTNSAANAMAWAMLTGFRFNYRHRQKITFFAQGDYLASVGTSFMGKSSMFSLREAPAENKYPNDDFGSGRTGISMMNISVGIKYLLGDQRDISELKEVQ